jgi:hypothetical protein
MNREMLKEAIAEAKTIKETAIASAKAALEEAFTPQLTAMFAERLNEMDEMDEADNMDETFSLEEILAELGVTEDDDTMTEGDKSDDDLMLEEMSDEDIEELVTQVIDDMIASGKLMAGEENEEDLEDVDLDVDLEDSDLGDEVEVDDEDEIKIDELLAEILDEEKEELNEFNIDTVDPAVGVLFALAGVPIAMGIAGLHTAAKAGKLGSMGTKIVNALEKAGAAVSPKNTGGSDSTKLEEKAELEDTINELRSELNEVNLLNAKLLYTNKIFKAKNLTESEKVKVLNTFDKAETVKEVKLVFETLTESFKATAKKSPIKESLGSASRTIAAPKQKEQIIEVNDAFARMQRLAGLRK